MLLPEQSVQETRGILVIGIGNQYRSDDAVGLRIAQDVKKEADSSIKIIEQNSDGAALLDSWKDAGMVILIDAVSSGGRPGSIYRFDAHKQPLPSRFFHYSTHAFGVAEAVELAKTLGQLPQSLIVYGIEGKCFDVGVGLTGEVENAIGDVVIRIRQDIHNQSLRKHGESLR